MPDEYQKTIRNLVKGKHFKNCIDLGCGNGVITELFIDCCGSISGVDTNEGALEECKKKISRSRKGNNRWKI